jgi:uncharacterized protein (DUF1697 family)
MLPMKDLVGTLERVGIHGAVTYIQSGNVAFRCSKVQAAELSRRIGSAIQGDYGIQPGVIVLSIQEVEHAIAVNPYPEGQKDPKSLHLFFLGELPASPDLEALKRLATQSERFTLHRRIFYLHAPEGIGQSKLAANVEKHLGVMTTARNWRTVTKTLQMAWDLV